MHIRRVAFRGRQYWAECAGDEVRILDQELREAARVKAQETEPLPLVQPGKIVCVGLNYYAHAREMNKQVPEEPLVFLKPPSAVIGPGQPIRLPAQSAEVHYEGELAVVMGRVCREMPETAVPECILGYTCANDVTARDLQNKDGLYARAKGFDTFCPLGPGIETDIDRFGDVQVRTLVNGRQVQNGRTSDLIVPVFGLISFISRIMTLHPGDVVLTGTPPGVGRLNPGDQVQVEIEGIGSLGNPVCD